MRYCKIIQAGGVAALISPNWDVDAELKRQKVLALEEFMKQAERDGLLMVSEKRHDGDYVKQTITLEMPDIP